VQSLEEEASRVQKALRIYVRDAGPLNTLASQLGVKGDGQVSFIVLKPEASGEVEVSLPGGYRISPQVASAMRAVPGVVEVELV
jgi:DNA polymerase-3 subunit alpha